MCAGMVTVAKPLSIECQMANYSNSLYEQLEEETGVRTGQAPSLHSPCSRNGSNNVPMWLHFIKIFRHQMRCFELDSPPLSKA